MRRAFYDLEGNDTVNLHRYLKESMVGNEEKKWKGDHREMGGGMEER